MSAVANCMACVNASCRICFVLFDIDEPIPIPIFRRFRTIAKSDYKRRHVRLSVGMEQLGYHWTDFGEI